MVLFTVDHRRVSDASCSSSLLKIGLGSIFEVTCFKNVSSSTIKMGVNGKAPTVSV